MQRHRTHRRHWFKCEMTKVVERLMIPQLSPSTSLKHNDVSIDWLFFQKYVLNPFCVSIKTVRLFGCISFAIAKSKWYSTDSLSNIECTLSNVYLPILQYKYERNKKKITAANNSNNNNIKKRRKRGTLKHKICRPKQPIGIECKPKRNVHLIWRMHFILYLFYSHIAIFCIPFSFWIFVRILCFAIYLSRQRMFCCWPMGCCWCYSLCLCCYVGSLRIYFRTYLITHHHFDSVHFYTILFIHVCPLSFVALSILCCFFFVIHADFYYSQCIFIPFCFCFYYFVLYVHFDFIFAVWRLFVSHFHEQKDENNKRFNMPLLLAWLYALCGIKATKLSTWTSEIYIFWWNIYFWGNSECIGRFFFWTSKAFIHFF